MKIILDSKTLLEKLNYLNGVLSTNNTFPILDNFLFESIGGELKITGSDLDNTISTTIEPVEDFNEQINVAIPGKILIEILKTLPHQPLIFVFLDNQTVELISESGKYAIAYSNGYEYPKPKEVELSSFVSIKSKVLAKAISKTVFATGTDDLRIVMTGVLFQMSPSGTNFVATDAHKLVKYSRSDVKASQVADFIMPRKPLNILKGILSSLDTDVIIDYNESNAKFTFENYTLSCRLIDGKYPNYEVVIPKDNPNKLLIDRVQFLNSIKCVSIFSNKQTHQIRLKIAGSELNISAEDADYSNKADERLTCNYQGNDLKIGFNAKFLADTLSNIGSNEIELKMSEPNKAGILSPVDGLDEGEELLMLVMPVILT